MRKKDCPLPLTKNGEQLRYGDLWDKGNCARLIPNHLKCPDSRLVGDRTETYVTLRLVMLVCFYQLIEGVIEGWWIWVPEGVPQPPNEFPYGYPAHVQGQGFGWIGPQPPPPGVIWPAGALHPHPPAPPPAPPPRLRRLRRPFPRNPRPRRGRPTGPSRGTTERPSYLQNRTLPRSRNSLAPHIEF